VNFDEYQHEQKRTWNVDWPWERQVSNALFGVIGEVGEIADIRKKVDYHGHDYDPAKMREEIGDLLHYVCALASLHGFYLDDIAEANIAKLKLRYPNGFTQADSRARVDQST
jgi:NTP pyrophosphatase (non-canonical NTP hydrolase)